MTTAIQNKLLAVIRAGLDMESTPLALSEADCREIIRIGTRQSIPPIIFRGLKNMGAPEAVIEESDRAQGPDLCRFMLHNYVLQQVGVALDEAKIPYILLKGATLRELYPAPELRTSCDMDVLVREENITRAVEAIESQTDLRTEQRAYHDISMTNARVHLELHFSVKENVESIDELLSHAWDYARPVGEGSRYTFTPDFQVFYVVAHMSYHMQKGGLGIRPLLDFLLLREKTDYDEQVVQQMCSACGLLKFYQTCADLVQVWVGEKEHTEMTEMLESVCLSGGVFGSATNVAASRLRTKSASAHIASRLFASRDLLENEYPRLREKPYLLPLYQVKRWTRLTNKQKRKRIRKEIRNVRTVSQQSIASFDQVLRRLEL